jgi:plasmid stabilization system protein ParE
MKVIIRESAEDDLDRIFAWIAKDNPAAAADMVAQIRDRINLLEIDSLAHIGRPGLAPLVASATGSYKNPTESQGTSATTMSARNSAPR